MLRGSLASVTWLWRRLQVDPDLLRNHVALVSSDRHIDVLSEVAWMRDMNAVVAGPLGGPVKKAYGSDGQ